MQLLLSEPHGRRSAHHAGGAGGLTPNNLHGRHAELLRDRNWVRAYVPFHALRSHVAVCTSPGYSRRR